jgi:hypothetical protein
VTAEELRDTLKQQPFEPFRLVMTDGGRFEIRHPDLLWIGRRTAYVGLVGQPGQTFFERSVKVNLAHIVRVEPIDGQTPRGVGGSTG